MSGNLRARGREFISMRKTLERKCAQWGVS